LLRLEVSLPLIPLISTPKRIAGASGQQTRLLTLVQKVLNCFGLRCNGGWFIAKTGCIGEAAVPGHGFVSGLFHIQLFACWILFTWKESIAELHRKSNSSTHQGLFL
jgi:hypothetical protein